MRTQCAELDLFALRESPFSDYALTGAFSSQVTQRILRVDKNSFQILRMRGDYSLQTRKPNRTR